MKILEASSAKSTTVHYESSFRKWSQYSERKGQDPFQPSIENVLEFLTELFNEGQSYSSINAAKSALSTIFNLMYNYKLGELEVVKKFMKGAFRLRPPTSRYNTTWNADKLLELLMSWPKNEELSMKNLTLKLAGLLALTTGQRVQTLAAININNIIVSNTVQIKITEILKTTRPAQLNPVFSLSKYHDQKLCVVDALLVYLSRTKSYRVDSNLFLALTKPHKSVCSQTISNWLVTLLQYSGVDTKVYHGHSYRHASTSKVASRGISADTIISHVGWSPSSTVFAKYYKRPIENQSNTFVNTVLKIE